MAPILAPAGFRHCRGAGSGSAHEVRVRPRTSARSRAGEAFHVKRPESETVVQRAAADKAVRLPVQGARAGVPFRWSCDLCGERATNGRSRLTGLPTPRGTATLGYGETADTTRCTDRGTGHRSRRVSGVQEICVREGWVDRRAPGSCGRLNQHDDLPAPVSDPRGGRRSGGASRVNASRSFGVPVDQRTGEPPSRGESRRRGRRWRVGVAGIHAPSIECATRSTAKAGRRDWLGE